MSIGSALKFEKSWVGDIWKGIKRDPKRLVLGVDPLSTKGWNAILGRNDKPVVGDFGGPTKEAYQNAQDKGISTGTASTLHGAAKGVAAALGAYYGANGLGNIEGSGLDAVGSGAYANGAVADAGLGAGTLGGAAEALPTVTVTGSTGAGGAIGAGAAGAGAGTAANSKGFNWQKLVQQGMGGGQQQQGQQSDWYQDYLRQQQEQRQNEMVRRQLAALLARQSQPSSPVFTL